jgi:S1-C subfamily serine protease
MAGLTVTAPKGLRSSVSLGGGGGGSGNSTPFGRTPTFLRHLDEEEHKTVQQLVKGVVQVFNNSVAHDWVSPWSKSPPSSSSGTGFIISVKKRLIITNAHCTTDAMTLQVRKDGDFDKVEARVLATSHESDLSIITVDESKFWEGAIELPLGQTPRLQQAVDVIGFPKGGDGISVTSGVVSRVDWGVYTHGHSCNLVVTVDAAINSGNSGGPAVSDGLVVGVAFQSLTGGDNIGFIIPAAVLRSVLQDFEATSPSGAPLAGFGHLECDVSTLENPAKRKWLGLPEGASGVQVGKIKELSKLKGVLVEGDVLTS